MAEHNPLGKNASKRVRADEAAKVAAASTSEGRIDSVPVPLEEQIRNAAARAGISEHELNVQFNASAIGDGVMFGKFLELLKLLLPVILPIIMNPAQPAVQAEPAAE